VIDLNGQVVSKEQLIELVALDVKKNPDVHAIIAADKTVMHGTVIEILDRLQLSGIKKFAINVQAP
jgi:biopolymer transport protein ExbD